MAIVRSRRSPMTRGFRPRGNTLRPVEWIRDCDGPSGIVAGSPVGFVIVEAADFDDFTRPTIVRIRGELLIYTADLVFGSLARVAYGITVVNPGEPPPDPHLQSRGNRWMWWGCTVLLNQSAETVELEDNITWIRVPFDVRSMRKRLVDGSNLQLVVSSDPAVGAGSVNAHVSASTLVKE